MQRVLYGEGSQTIYFAPIDRHGIPSVASSPLYTIVDLRYSTTSDLRTIQAQAAATPVTATETTNAACGPAQADPRKIDVTDASDFVVGRKYLLRQADGKRESVTLARVDTTSNDLYAANDIQQDFASGATISGYELKGTFPSTYADDVVQIQNGGGPYQVIWEYTASSDKLLVPELIYLVRYSTGDFHVSVEDVLLFAPTLARRAGETADLHKAIAAATRQFVAELEAAGIDPSLYRASNWGPLAIVHKACELMYRWVGSTDNDREAADWHSQEYGRMKGDGLVGREPVGTTRLNRGNDDAPIGPESRNYNQSLMRRS